MTSGKEVDSYCDDDYDYDDENGSFWENTTIPSRETSLADNDSKIESDYNIDSYSSNEKYQESWGGSYCGSSFSSSYSEDSYEC
mmetsp:Transcript_28752/g.33400  ORF Transcript_28752/g.33400 Transcript_28752/m.33400 type:complete len:84 (-) Transcript_28752:583-834(-)